MLNGHRLIFAVGMLAVLVLASRTAMLGADFPPISASVSEYGDMGFCLQNVRSKLIEGEWKFDDSTVSLGSPLHSLLVYAACSVGGLSGAMVSVVAAAAFMLMWGAAAYRWSRRLSPEATLAGLILLGAQHVLFAYSFSWKQEMLMVSLAILGLLLLDLRGWRGAVASGVVISMACLTKLSAVGACMACLGALMFEDRPIRERIRNILVWTGACLALPLALLLAARINFEPREWANLTSWLGAIVADRVGRNFSLTDRVLNIFRTNIVLRSFPEMALGLGLALPCLFSRGISRTHRALVFLVLVHLAGLLVAPYYPLRWILPATAASVFLAVEGPWMLTWRKGPAAAVIGVLFGQAVGFMILRFWGGASVLTIVGTALLAAILSGVGLMALRPLPLRLRRCAVVTITIVGIAHGMIDARWILNRRFDQADISRAVESIISSSGGGSVAPFSFIGWQVLWPTRLKVESDANLPARYALWDSTEPASHFVIPEKSTECLDSGIALADLDIILYRVPAASPMPSGLPKR